MATVHSGEDYLEHFNANTYLQEYHTIPDLWHGVFKQLHDTFKHGMFTHFNLAGFPASGKIRENQGKYFFLLESQGKSENFVESQGIFL